MNAATAEVESVQTPESLLAAAGERVLSEGPILAAEAGPAFGEITGRPRHSDFVRKMMADGVGLPDGSRLYLESTTVGGHTYTSRLAIARFVCAQNRSIREARQARRSQQAAESRVDDGVTVA